MNRILKVFLVIVLSPTALFGDEFISAVSLKDLFEIKVDTAGSLTKTSLAKTPASITRITHEMIRHSGARSLDELLEIYVPSFQRIKSGGAGPHFGIRGIVSDLDNKSLLLVNGKMMNDENLYGVMSERHIPILGDIESIEVVRGPGSAIYGPGAINGVISIKTFNPMTFAGSHLSLRQGVVEEFSLLEYKKGHLFSEDSGIFLHFGLSHYDGAEPEDSPLVYSKDGDFFSAGADNTTSDLVNHNGTPHNKPNHKIHINYKRKDFDLWLRSVRGSTQYTDIRHFLERQGTFESSNRTLAYHHTTLALQQKLMLSDAQAVTLDASYDVVDFVSDRGIRTIPVGFEHLSAAREDEFQLKAMLESNLGSGQQLALGAEYSRHWFFKDLLFLSDDPSHASTLKDRFNSTTLSLVSEYQWEINPEWIFFLGGRADKHNRTDIMYSPKFALVFAPNEKQQVKLMLNRSVRKSEDSELKRQTDLDLSPELETIDFLELSHTWHFHEQLSHTFSLFAYNHDILGFLPQEARETEVGTSRVYGFEFELAYKAGSHDLTLSHGYTKLIDYDPIIPELINQVITSEPYGYGDDLQNWANHISKLNWTWRFRDAWRLDTSLAAYWKYPGAESYTSYNNEILNAVNRSQSDGRTDAFDSSVFLNTGLTYEVRDNMKTSLNLHNILGLVEEDLNKRNFYARLAGYRIEAPSASLAFDYKF